MQHTGHNIKVIRRLHGFTLTDMATLLGRSVTQYRRCERGMAPFTDVEISQIATKCGTPERFIRGGKLAIKIEGEI